MENNEKNKLAKSYREFLSNIRPTNLSAQTVSEKFYLPYGSNFSTKYSRLFRIYYQNPW